MKSYEAPALEALNVHATHDIEVDIDLELGLGS